MRTPKSMPKSPIGRVPPDQMPPWLREQWHAVNDQIGDATSAEVFANQPAASSLYTGEIYPRLFFNRDGDMHVEHKYKELFRFKMGIMHGCYMCNTFNWQTTLDAGYTKEQLDHALAPTPELFSAKELAILELADCFVLWNQDAHLTPELYDRLRAHIGDAGIVELGVMGAFFMGWQRLLFAYDLVPREQDCPLP
jgi:alkylhydroperoxidase family enzyme